MRKKIILAIAILVIITTVVMGELEQQQRNVSEGFFKEGVYHFNQQEYTAASNAFLNALSTDPNYFKARYWLGRAYYHNGHYQNAIEEWQRVISAVGQDHLLKNKVNRLQYQRVGNPILPIDEVYQPTKYFKSLPQKGIKSPVSIYLDENKQLWVVGYQNNQVAIFNKNGELVDTITSADKPFNRPFDIIRNSKGITYISDFGNDKIHKFDKNRSYLSSLGQSGLNKGEFYGPQGLTVDKLDQLYVVDKSNHRVQKFDENDNFLIQFGTKGHENSELFNPTDVVVLNNKIYVTDTGNKRIQVYNQNGNWVQSIGDDIFSEPMGIKVASKNELLVVDRKKGIYQVIIDPLEIKLILKKDKKIISPMDIAFDQNHFLYIIDSQNPDIPIYVPEKMKYTSLDVSVIQSYISKYPRVTHRVAVKDQMGQSIYGLNKNNFYILENEHFYPVKIFTESDFKKRLSISILNERSVAMKNHLVQLNNVSRNLLKSFAPEDMIEVINYNDEAWVSQPFINSVYSPLKAIFEKNLKEQANIGEAFYKGVSDNLTKNDYTGAIILITSGELEENTFNPYGYEVCLNYAKNNMIPVYVISFSEGSMKEELKDLAKLTGGKYFNAYTSNDLKDIVQMIRKYQNSIYYLQYNAEVAPTKSNKWREIKVKVVYRDLFGQDRAGYFIQ